MQSKILKFDEFSKSVNEKISGEKSPIKAKAKEKRIIRIPDWKTY
jgi:hypothetical protein